jgi:hypothetical protein
MPATVDTNEQFPTGTAKAQMDAEVALRLKAGAISSKYTGSETEGWVLITTWNVIGEQ